ncbi:hypothetical protein [Rhodanobacter sp. MP7CTX1]|uniref:hypothetical protein n=1 Tax=Rhodanobacter sp. MP7CTX1 TaxID=2723084 RepID=UPI00161FC817|nr:hypothetical protein [Rhodanobacter sp. MP7CTX1]MBB6186536.1 hypothetical protein [Rhodanobacter sp. MP7CTX1]
MILAAGNVSRSFMAAEQLLELIEKQSGSCLADDDTVYTVVADRDIGAPLVQKGLSSVVRECSGADVPAAFAHRMRSYRV